MARRTGPDEITHVETLARVFRNVGAIVIFIVAGTLVLDTLGLSISPILATAAVAALAIGFGPQNLINDYFTGLFILLVDQIRPRVVVQIARKAGLLAAPTLT